MNFNPRSREGSDSSGFLSCAPYHYFNPRSREGSDVSPFLFSLSLSISIHAPAKGATVDGLQLLLYSRLISIHAPAKGATSGVYSSPANFLFQSTLPRRERHKNAEGYRVPRNFNPRSREGSDNKLEWQLPCMLDFNPRSREGSDVRGKASDPAYPDFNPRSREGSDNLAIKGFFESEISIHAPAKGATPRSGMTKGKWLFQSTLPRRERLRMTRSYRCSGEFQSTLPRRERRYRLQRFVSHAIFQSTLPRRERRHRTD